MTKIVINGKEISAEEINAKADKKPADCRNKLKRQLAMRLKEYRKGKNRFKV